jgi:hypothetical protein
MQKRALLFVATIMQWWFQRGLRPRLHDRGE